MRSVFDLANQAWTLAGCVPFFWENAKAMETGAQPTFEIAKVPARLPGSVQGALLEAGIIPDWNAGVNHRACEWVENRHWVFETRVPLAWLKGKARARLLAEGLDGNGRVFWNGVCAGRFDNAFVPHAFELAIPKTTDDVLLMIVFETPPRWLGQFGRTSEMREWKTRFGYSWDWMTRLVQIGVYDRLRIEVRDDAAAPVFEAFRCYTEYDPATRQGVVRAQGDASGAHAVRLELRNAERVTATREYTPGELANGICWSVGEVAAWWPNNMGEQALYRVVATALDAKGVAHDCRERTVGFRRIEWRPCEGAPVAADPWICVVNNRPVFLQGINWTPIQCNFADATDAALRGRVNAWRDAGMNTFRVWGGAVLERGAFYEACDRAGMLVWQELPLSSSGIDNEPPTDAASLETLGQIARGYAVRRQHHPSLFLWCGGNELQTAHDGSPGCGKPLNASHPALRRAGEVFNALDPTRRFLATSSSGPNFYANFENYGKGVHWDIHGPWTLGDMTLEKWREYWAHDDALIRSETGAPGASSPELIRQYTGGMDPLPISLANPYWRRMPWWVESDAFARAHDGRAPADLEVYCAWSRARQAEALVIAFCSAKERFPRCGGFLFWMGHDTFPCCTNTAIMEFDGTPKPALDALRPFLKNGGAHVAQ